MVLQSGLWCLQHVISVRRRLRQKDQKSERARPRLSTSPLKQDSEEDCTYTFFQVVRFFSEANQSLKNHSWGSDVQGASSQTVCVWGGICSLG